MIVNNCKTIILTPFLLAKSVVKIYNFAILRIRYNFLHLNLLQFLRELIKFKLPAIKAGFFYTLNKLDIGLLNSIKGGFS